MELINYVKTCIAGAQSSDEGQIPSIIALALLGFFVVSVLLKMLKGFRKGARRQVLSTVMILISVGLSMILTRIASSLLINLVTVENIQKAATEAGINNETVTQYINVLKDIPEETLQYLCAIPVAVLLAPILFLVVYAVVRFITFIVQLIIRKAAHIGKPANIGERFAGLLLGGVEAIIVASITILPATSIVSFADEIITTIDSGTEAKEGFDEFKEGYDKYIVPCVINNPALWLANNTANNTIVDTISKVPAGSGESENLREEFMDLIEIIFVEIPGLKDVDFVQPDEEEKALIENLINRIADNDIIAAILSGAISTTATITDPAKLGLDLEPPLDAIARDVMTLLTTCSMETLKEDMHLIKDIYFLLADEEILLNMKGDGDLLEAMIKKREGEDKSVVQRLIALINENERTKPLITTLTKLSISMLVTNGLGNEEFNVDEAYEDLRGTMNNVLAVDSNDYETHEEYIDAVTNTLDESLREHDIVIEEREVLTNIAEYIDENYGSSSELSEEEFNDVLLSYFDAYIEYQNSGTIPDDMLPPDVNPDDITDDIPDNIPDNIDPDGWNRVEIQ